MQASRTTPLPMTLFHKASGRGSTNTFEYTEKRFILLHKFKNELVIDIQ